MWEWDLCLIHYSSFFVAGNKILVCLFIFFHRRYADIPVEDIRKICPACRGICTCKVCLRGDNLIKVQYFLIQRFNLMCLANIIPLLYLALVTQTVLLQTKVQEIAGIDKLRYLHSLLSFVLPVLKQIYSEQCFEIAVETRVHGICFILRFLSLWFWLYLIQQLLYIRNENWYSQGKYTCGWADVLVFITKILLFTLCFKYLHFY